AANTNLSPRAEIITKSGPGRTGDCAAVVPGAASRPFQTTADLRPGQTMAVAGVTQNSVCSPCASRPAQSDWPLFNRLFGTEPAPTPEKELVVLITPEVVQPQTASSPRPSANRIETNDL